MKNIIFYFLAIAWTVYSKCDIAHTVDTRDWWTKNSETSTRGTEENNKQRIFSLLLFAGWVLFIEFDISMLEVEQEHNRLLSWNCRGVSKRVRQVWNLTVRWVMIVWNCTLPLPLWKLRKLHFIQHGCVDRNGGYLYNSLGTISRPFFTFPAIPFTKYECGSRTCITMIDSLSNANNKNDKTRVRTKTGLIWRARARGGVANKTL